MSFIDELTIHASAGRGGDGVVLWRHERAKEFAGASGGNGGKGGDVYVRAVRDLSILNRYRNAKAFVAGAGGDGMRNSMHGKDGDDITIDLPIGSVVTDTRISRVINLATDGEIVKILKGGKGGLGNEHFKASTNVTPMQSTPGREGEEADFHIELELVADGGLIGLPNAGKSSLLNALTNAQAKVGSYQFTTLEPNLGALSGGFVLADIPGLIEGASEGKGLGHKFLRHVKRTRMLFHIISLEHMLEKKGADEIVSVYKTIRAELKQYDATREENLSGKPEVIILTKTDVFGTDAKVISAGVTEAKRALSKISKIPQKDILAVTILDDVSVKVLGDEMVKRLRV